MLAAPMPHELEGGMLAHLALAPESLATHDTLSGLLEHRCRLGLASRCGRALVLSRAWLAAALARVQTSSENRAAVELSAWIMMDRLLRMPAAHAADVALVRGLMALRPGQQLGSFVRRLRLDDWRVREIRRHHPRKPGEYARIQHAVASLVARVKK